MKDGFSIINTALKGFMIVLLCICLWPGVSNASSGAQLVDIEKLKELFVTQLEGSIQWDDAEVEISSLKVLPKKIWVPEGDVTFEFSQQSLRGRIGRISQMVSILVDGKPVRKARVCAYLEVFKDVLSAPAGLVRGQVISSSDLSYVRMPLSKLRGRFFDSPEQVVGLAAKRSIRPGKIIFANDVAKPMVVKRGSRVLIVASSPCLRITVPGIVEQKGAEGDFVRVRNLDSKKVIIARVKDENTVLVRF